MSISVGELQKVVNQLEDNKVYSIGINDVFSWRGSYCEPCFSFGRDVTGKQMKELVDKCLSETFTGWKGGEFSYRKFNDANFEADHGNYTDGAYLTSIMVKYQDEEFIKMLFELIDEGSL